jgi:hypothetical protein
MLQLMSTSTHNGRSLQCLFSQFQACTSVAINTFHTSANIIDTANCPLQSTGLENRDYGQRDSLHWPRVTLYPQKLLLTLLTSSGRSVCIVPSGTQATEFSFLVNRQYMIDAYFFLFSTPEVWLTNCPSSPYKSSLSVHRKHLPCHRSRYTGHNTDVLENQSQIPGKGRVLSFHHCS